MLKWVIALSLFFPSFAIQAQEVPDPKTYEVIQTDPRRIPPQGQPVLDVDLVAVKDTAIAEKTEASLIRQLISNGHEIIEGQESGKFFEDWRNAFNARRIFLDGRRWFNSNRGSAMEHLAFSLIFSVGLSHSTEMMSGPIAVSVGVAQGWPEWLITTLGVAGGVISVPGLDPLCFAVVGLYLVSPKFQKVMGLMRLAVVKTAEGLWKYSTAEMIFKKIFQRPDFREWATQLENVENIKEFKNGELLIRYAYPHENPQLKLEILVKNNERPFLSQVHVSPEITLRTTQLASPWLKKLGFDGNDFVKKFIARVSTTQESTVDPSRWRWKRLNTYLEAEGEMKGFLKAILRSYSFPDMSQVFGSQEAFYKVLSQHGLLSWYQSGWFFRTRQDHRPITVDLLEVEARQFIVDSQKAGYVERLQIRAGEWSRVTLKEKAVPAGPAWERRPPGSPAVMALGCKEVFKASRAPINPWSYYRGGAH